MGEAQGQRQCLALGLRTVADPDQFELALKALADAGDQVVDQGAHGAGHGRIAGLAQHDIDLVVLLLDADVPVDVHRHLSNRPLHGQVLALQLHIHALGNLNRLFCNS